MRRLAALAALALGACAHVVPTYEDALTPGILLEPEERDVAGGPLRPVYDKGLAVTKASEGFRPRVYNDAARYCTIAYGHLIKKAPCDGSEPPEFLSGVTEPRAGELLTGDMARAQRAVLALVEVQLTDGQYGALCDFTYNVGSGNLQRSELLQAVNAREIDRVPAQLLRWQMAGGRVIPGLRVRREREIELFFDGQPVPRVARPGGAEEPLLDIRTGR